MKLSKTSIIAAACLGALALTGVGFAGWYIVSDAGETKTGNITVYDITNNAVVISQQKWINKAVSPEEEIKGAKDGAAVIFGSPKDAATHDPKNSYSWFGFDSESGNGKTAVEAECFPVYSFTLTDYSKNASSTNMPTVTATLKIAKSSDTQVTDEKYKAALAAYYTCQKGVSSKTYIKGLELVEKSDDSTPTYKAKENGVTIKSNNGLKIEYQSSQSYEDGTTNSGNKYAVTIDLGFGWGTNFVPSGGSDENPVNPYYYYGNLEQTDDNVKNANTVMGEIEKISGLTYTLTITASPATGTN